MGKKRKAYFKSDSIKKKSMLKFGNTTKLSSNMKGLNNQEI